MEILILGYSSLIKGKILPLLKNKFTNIKFSICSKSQKKKNIGALHWYRDYEEALKKSKAEIVYISLTNSLHYYWAKKFLLNNYHVIIDKPATLNFEQAKDLVKLAKIKKKLLTEAVVFNYHNQIDKALKEIHSQKNLIHVDARFVIPKFPKKDWHNFKRYGGGCLTDMGPYAAAVYRIFISSKIINFNFFSLCKVNKNSVNENFAIKITSKKKTFTGFFSHNGKYENTLTIFTKYKSVKINRVFSPPNDLNLTLQINEGNIRKVKKLNKDDSFFNYFKKIFILLKTKKFNPTYKSLISDSLFRKEICLKKNIIKI